MTKIMPVILCGGSGTRLWPRSRAIKPKPFLPLVGQSTLFEESLRRVSDPAIFAPPTIVTGVRHLEHVEEQLAGSPGARIIVEPAARNTAAAIALAAQSLPPEQIMLVCPSDHFIGKPNAFTAAVNAAATLAKEGWLVALGIEPTAPETGFGYIRRGESINELGFRIASFVEKPHLERAMQFLAAGEYSWNGGIFIFRAGDFLAELTNFRPSIAAAIATSVAEGSNDGQRFYPDAEAFIAADSESIDYAVMEKTERAAMVPVDMAWSDIGNWDALYEARPKDNHGNSVHGPAELVDCREVMVDTDGPRVSVIGLEGVIVVVDGKEVLVTSAAGVQKVGKLKGASNQ